MAKKMTKAESQLLGWLIIIGIPVYGIVQLGEQIGWEGVIGICAFLPFLYVLFKLTLKKIRRSWLMSKYNNEERVNKLLAETIWQGQTVEQLIDTIGKPHDIDQKVLKTKKKETWKYNHQGANRYGLRVILDNDEVIGWDNKD